MRDENLSFAGVFTVGSTVVRDKHFVEGRPVEFRLTKVLSPEWTNSTYNSNKCNKDIP